MSTEKDRIFYAKLEALRDVRAKTIQMEKLRARILQEVEAKDREEKCLLDYKQEMEALTQEKMAHVEELRQIHSDINSMENVIKQSEEARNRALEAARRFHDEYLPLKLEIDRMRMEYLGLDRLPDLHESDSDLIGQDFFQKHFAPPKPDWRPELHFAAASTFAMTAHQTHAAGPSSVFLPPPHPTLSLGPTHSKAVADLQRPSIPSIPGPTPTFRQQPPPMKSCLSCHQQIHRNAPICPLCKAKSRSRNPKKPKKKPPT
ncbi:hypothetical protein RUM43_013933 [Polyplax serrata]|uniref:C4H2-type domain-containing protein n=1 Tax=Polyplax serrata TaxID=468196 RepID=A0AAN8PHL1_POLSC